MTARTMVRLDGPLLIATGNPGKLSEFRDLLADAEIATTGLSSLGDISPVEETGRTFSANARLKASGYAVAAGMWALADDSGLAVDALGGAPGVHSARWAQMHQSGAGDADNNALLLRQLADVPDERRGARFVCMLALADPSGRVLLTAAGSVAGRILREPRGANGFGYDPLFLVEALGRTTAELPSAEKHRLSHRGQAIRRLRAILGRMGLTGPYAQSDLAGLNPQ